MKRDIFRKAGRDNRKEWEEENYEREKYWGVRIWVVGKAEVGGGGTEEFPASLFPGLCKGLIKYGWCLEQSRGKWDSTNSTSSQADPFLLWWSPAVFSLRLSFRLPPLPPLTSPSSHFYPLVYFLTIPLFWPFSQPSSVSVFQTEKCMSMFLSFPSTNFISSSSASSSALSSAQPCFFLFLCALPHSFFSLPPCDAPLHCSLPSS